MPDHASNPAAARQGARLLAGAIIFGQICALLRYVVLTRALGPAELGLAVIVVLAGQLFDSVTDSGYDRFMVQDRGADAAPAQAQVQLFAMLRGVMVAGLLFISAPLVAAFFDAPRLTEGVMLLAAMPLLAGLVHLDMRRVQRGHDFRPEGRAIIAAELLGLAATTGVAIATGSFFAIVAGLVTRAAVMTLMTHIQARRPYRVGRDAATMARLWAFAAPLMVSGLLLFLGGQGDRLVVGKLLGPAEVGLYSAVALLIFYPTAVVQRLIANVHLPLIVPARADHVAQSDALGGATLILAIAMALGFALVAPVALPLLFGPAFAQPVLIVVLVGILNCARFLRLWPVNILLAQGTTRGILASNVTRLIAFPAAFAAIVIAHSIVALVVAFIVGELAALVVALVFANRAMARPEATGMARLALFSLCGISMVGAALAVPTGLIAQSAAILVTAIISLAVLHWREGDALRALLRLLPGVAPRG